MCRIGALLTLPGRGRAIAYGNIGDGGEPSYPPLEGEGRPHRTKFSFVRCGRGGVIVHPQPIHSALPAAHPTPARDAAIADLHMRSPCPPEEAKKVLRLTFHKRSTCSPLGVSQRTPRARFARRVQPDRHACRCRGSGCPLNASALTKQWACYFQSRCDDFSVSNRKRAFTL